MSSEEMQGVLAKVLAPLVEGDGGELYLLPSREGSVRLHLGGRFSGCPGNSLVTEQVVRPLIEAAQPGTRLEISSGALVPPGAERIRPPAAG